LVLVVYAILTMETLMRTSAKRIGLSALLLLFTGVPISFGGEGLIAPTRSLEGHQEDLGRLTVVSEPPGLEVFLDDSEIGQTPVWVKEVKPGSHELRVRRSETDVYVETGKTLTLSFFKGSFIVVPEEKEVGKELASEPGKVAEGRRRVKPREEERPKDLTPWERFLNGTSPTF